VGRAELPAPPAAAGLSPAVAAHLRERYAAASQARGNIAAVGPLCIAYHADMLFDLADRCYAIAGDLESRNWRWRYFRAMILTERGGGDALVAMLRGIVKEAPQFGPAWLRLGDAEFKAANYDGAAGAWRRAIDLPEPAPEPGDSPSHVVEFPMRAYASLGLARVALVIVRGRFSKTSPGPGRTSARATACWATAIARSAAPPTPIARSIAPIVCLRIRPMAIR
jgi:tetratricopeptide (TPR) repeat protein